MAAFAERWEQPLGLVELQFCPQCEVVGHRALRGVVQGHHALATAFAACGGSSSSEDPQKVIDNASLEGVKSANLDLSLGIKAEGEEGGDVNVALSGPFQSEGKNQLPELDLSAKANGSFNGKDINFDGGFTLLSDRAFVNYKGTEYEVDPTTFGFVKSGFEQAEQEGGSEGNSADVTACQEAATGLKVGDFVDNLTNEGSADVDGTSTTKVSGDLNVSGAIDSILEVVESQACRAQLAAAGPLPSKSEVDKAKSQVGNGVKSAHVDVYVGDDNIVRRISAQMQIEPQGNGSGPKSIEIELDLKLTEVNEEQTISAPANAKPLSGLFIKLGINPIELLGLLQGEEGGESLGELFEGLAESQSH